MKLVLAIIAVTMMSGCASYNTHLRTGCIWSCDKWEQWEKDGQLANTGGPVANTYTPNKGITAQTYITPQGGFQVIRSGSTTTINRISR